MTVSTKAAEYHPWLQEVDASLPSFLASLKIENEHQTKWMHCREGLTESGLKVELGVRCFVAKTLWTTGIWHRLQEAERQLHVEGIRSFQLPPRSNSLAPDSGGSFWDPAVISELTRRQQWWRRHRAQSRLQIQQALLAETKQALATLAGVGERPRWPFLDLPLTTDDLRIRCESMDWSRPWAAGGQTAALAACYSIQREAIGTEVVDPLLQYLREFFASLLDPETGAYFRGNRPPQHGELINGAMKVLTALSWLEVPVHRPEALIDACLAVEPRSEGCHIVDALYVLDQCLRVSDYRRPDAVHFALLGLKLIRHHYNADGGFSYWVGRSQTSYYGVTISTGRPVSDIHGTCLLTWAIALALNIIGDNFLNWSTLKP